MIRNLATGRARTTLLSLVTVVSLTMVPARTGGQQPADIPCGESLAAGFRLLDERFWDGPWAFETRGSTALTALDNSRGELTNGPIRIRLDDATIGTLRIFLAHISLVARDGGRSCPSIPLRRSRDPSCCGQSWRPGRAVGSPLKTAAWLPT